MPPRGASWATTVGVSLCLHIPDCMLNSGDTLETQAMETLTQATVGLLIVQQTTKLAAIPSAFSICRFLTYRINTPLDIQIARQ